MAPPPMRVLIVEDENDWIELMTLALEDEAEARKVPAPSVDTATDSGGARRLMALNHYHLISLDMRLPAEEGDTLDVKQGKDLVREPSTQNYLLSKAIIYSGTLSPEEEQGKSVPGHTVAQLPDIDNYAKSSGGQTAADEPFETLSPRQWASRVLDYLDLLAPQDPRPPRALTLEPTPGRKFKTALGNWLSAAAQSMPPVLARHARALEQHWPVPGSGKVDTRAVDAALKFVEASLRLAVAQTAVLLDDGLPAANVKEKTSWLELVDLLEVWAETHGAALSRWSWGTHLTNEVIAAFKEIRELRSKTGQRLGTNNPLGSWSELYPSLRLVMDMAGYWAKHPLVANLTYRPDDGWKGEILSGTSYPRPIRPLAGKKLPDHADRHIWQLPVCAKAASPGWEEVPVDWNAWLRIAPDNERALWLAIHSNRNTEVVAFDLADGERIGRFPD